MHKIIFCYLKHPNLRKDLQTWIFSSIESFLKGNHCFYQFFITLTGLTYRLVSSISNL